MTQLQTKQQKRPEMVSIYYRLSSLRISLGLYQYLTQLPAMLWCGVSDNWSSESPLILCTIHSDMYITQNADIVTNPLGTRYRILLCRLFSLHVLFLVIWVIRSSGHGMFKCYPRILMLVCFGAKVVANFLLTSLFCFRYWTALLWDRIQRSLRKLWLNGKNCLVNAPVTSCGSQYLVTVLSFA